MEEMGADTIQEVRTFYISELTDFGLSHEDAEAEISKPTMDVFNRLYTQNRSPKKVSELLIMRLTGIKVYYTCAKSLPTSLSHEELVKYITMFQIKENAKAVMACDNKGVPQEAQSTGYREFYAAQKKVGLAQHRKMVDMLADKAFSELFSD
ncbi:hypothetical protein B0T16DRAFT_494944 [Cercophora newfieldiana]|uniref:Uncharacterized protein n=1 Tax=Cercophora newfieldiana TaxID=92897 RepID=A0AA39Y119_9PEZI|nr:hypothetical protein B0T16DRAFT_494944 [Cercophora newfieldiana]